LRRKELRATRYELRAKVNENFDAATLHRVCSAAVPAAVRRASRPLRGRDALATAGKMPRYR
jgi:hypothetical protein